MTMDITLTELEDAINYWRLLRPSTGEERALSPEVNALATIYAEMIFNHAKTVPFEHVKRDAQRLWTLWREQRR
jgi:Protein of unknown function (DUF3717)